MKRILTIMAICILLIMLPVVVYAGEISYCELGDIDNDWRITAADARLALRLSVSLEDNLCDVQKKAADVNKNNKHDADDARSILRASVGLDFMTNDGIVAKNAKPATTEITQTDVDDLVRIGCEYIKWLGVDVNKEYATGFMVENISFDEHSAVNYENGMIFNGSPLTPKEIVKRYMLNAIYATYSIVTSESGNKMDCMYPIFADTTHPGSHGTSWTMYPGYCLSAEACEYQPKSAPYNYPYVIID